MPLTAGAKLSAVLDRLVDLLLPARCGGCDRLGRLYCDTCLALTRRLDGAICLRCGAATESRRSDCGCRRRLRHLARIRSAAVHEVPLERAIHRFKYRGRAALARPFALLLAERLAVEGLPARAIGWVPLHPRRLRERGYDQARLLAVEVARLTGLPLLRGSLRRVRETPPQVGLDRLDRQKNVAGAFVYSGEPEAGPVLLIDDVATTGATLDAAAAALQGAGISPVFGFTVARATV